MLYSNRGTEERRLFKNLLVLYNDEIVKGP